MRHSCAVEDNEVIDAFLDGAAAGGAFGRSLHVEGDSLQLGGWWCLAFRVSSRTVLVRDEEAPVASTVPEDLAAALTTRGLSAVGDDLPAITVVTFAYLDLGHAPWMVWSVDLTTGEAELNAKAIEESSPQQGLIVGGASDRIDSDSAYVRGARRAAGAPAHVVLAIGVSDDRSRCLEEQLVDCQIERRAFAEIDPADCGLLFPTLVIVDATGAEGSAFVAALHAHGSTVGPLVAITDGGAMHVGADATVDAQDQPDHWVPLLQALIG